MLESFLDLVRRAGLRRRLPGPGEVLRLRDLPGAAGAGVAAALSREESLVVLAAHSPGAAEELFADVEGIAGSASVRYFPQRESLPSEDSDPHVEISGRRVETLAALLGGRVRLLVTTARALVERSPVAAGGNGFALALRVGGTIRLDTLSARLHEMGFDRVHTVQELGEFAVRGGIVDLFPFGHDLPLRVELWEDEIASLRRFDLVTQRSVGRVESAEILPLELGPALPDGEGERRSLLELLPEGTLLIEPAPEASAERRAGLWRELQEARSGTSREEALPPEALALPPGDAAARLDRSRRLHFVPEPEAGVLDLGIRPPPAIQRRMEKLVGEIERAIGAGERVLLLCDNEGQLERLEDILTELAGRELSRRVTLALGSVSGGFRLPPPEALLVLTDHEIFQRIRRLRRTQRFHGAATLESIASLVPGDYVVHLDHGIGRYRGLERVEVGGESIETLAIEYAGGEILRVPHYRLDLIERWRAIGEDGSHAPPPRVHKLGGKKWRALRRRTVESIRQMATELIELYAQRQIAPGFTFSPESRWQRELESSFLYEDTRDQRAAWQDVRRDMEAPRPMDRLVCGDVGYGKTEIAIRAAFKAIQDGRQVAVLAPTTVLAEQHLHTFRERLAGFPVRIEAISRLRTRAEQAALLAALAKGSVDILIGTHRLLSHDVKFRELGLVVVDEEQRFGVRHKERLKELKRSVDVLTLTATPIPRTLQLALGGIRDMSLIDTAPRDRMPVITHVLQWSDGIIQDAMRRELDRGGQIFFVHDRIETIDILAERVRRLLPEGRIAVAHGRTPERKLEATMQALMEHEIDVLVSTSIIENGLDVPSANTMIVHRADRFGLAQLYQLRGRVGRSHHRAYCYLLIPAQVPFDAERRLRVLEHYTELGSGYRVALKDLHLRGAGNLLGAAQSGFAQAVGFDTYQRLLEQAVRRLKGGEEAGAADEAPQVSVEGEAYLPDAYILDSEQKLHLYRRIARARSLSEIAELAEEMRDRFGPVPDAAQRLLTSIRLKLAGAGLGIESIRTGEAAARVNFRPDATPRLAVLRHALHDRQIDVEVRRTQPLSLVLRMAGVEPLAATLIAALERLSDAKVMAS
ncbi:MAG: transcription-repair coupling factor [Gemmatimonadota bacterium]